MQLDLKFHRVDPGHDRLVQALEPWIHEASTPYADWHFGDSETAAEAIRRWMRRPSSELYVGRATLMCDPEQRPLGCVIGMSGTEIASCRARDFAALCAALDANPESDELVAQTIEVSRALFAEVEDDEFYISRVAVDPARRARGLGRAMLRHVIASQRALGFSRFKLDVSADNAAAIRMYEAVGMQVVRRGASEDAGLEYCTMALSV